MGLDPILRYERNDVVYFFRQDLRNIAAKGGIGNKETFNQIKNQDAQSGKRNDGK